MVDTVTDIITDTIPDMISVTDIITDTVSDTVTVTDIITVTITGTVTSTDNLITNTTGVGRLRDKNTIFRDNILTSVSISPDFMTCVT